MFQMLTEHPWAVLEQLVTTQAQANAKLWKSVNNALGRQDSRSTWTPHPLVRVQKMTTNNDPEAFLNTL